MPRWLTLNTVHGVTIHIKQLLVNIFHSLISIRQETAKRLYSCMYVLNY